ncbi:MAG: hypothetical protein GC190_01055 [Alphaproteobacteria bacterium]|nr:hypothetical protein [Alphaproteobacteria bacterium]
MVRFFRVIAGAVIEFISWFALVTLFGIAAGLAWPALAEANRAFNATQTADFDQQMLIARLGLAAAASIVAAWIAGLTVRDNRIAPIVGGLALLALFVPVHLGIWDKFPLWYHVTFLTSLPVLAFIGGRLAPSA